MSTGNIKKFTAIVNADICNRIKVAAAEAGISRTDLAKSTGVAYRTVYSVMQGTANLRDATIGKFAKALGVSYSELAGEPGPSCCVKAPGLADMSREEEAENRSGIRQTSKRQSLRIALQVIADQLEIPLDRVISQFLDVLMREANGPRGKKEEG